VIAADDGKKTRKCTGADDCKICKSCKDCGYCKDGKTCGVCKHKKGKDKPAR